MADWKKFGYDNVDDFASCLLGSCEDIPSDILDEMTMEELEILDNITLCCPSCGWWVGAECMYDDEMCDDCHEDSLELGFDDD